MIRANQTFMSLWLIKVLTLIFLRSIPELGLSQHLTGPSLSLQLGLWQVGRGPGSISWRFREPGINREE